ncbi:unnamed protein product [Eruca vesicaria subsp. sativa]|uniref:Uncharacterized protein n=1 Tax=Eruca vesicaria subsp. sativa TaxID=29727 RepID=A0ABC8KKS6_ERUVS|nr:unnamed protein product [Eruca vesicaria subsp. sativa]
MTLQSLPSPIPSCKWLVDHMVELGFLRSLSEWIGSNLKRSGDSETWAFNLDGAIQMFKSYRETSYWSLLANPPKATEISFVIAEKSDRWNKDTTRRLETIAKQRHNVSEEKVSTHVLRNSAHWVHTEKKLYNSFVYSFFLICCRKYAGETLDTLKRAIHEATAKSKYFKL